MGYFVSQDVSAGRHSDTKTDRRLLEETRAGRAESFEVLYRRHHAVGARVAITDSHAYYLIDMHFPHSHTCRSYEVLDNTRSDLRAGKHVTFSEGITPRSCPGHYWGSVSYVPDVGQSGYQFGLPSASGSLVVGRFSFHLR